MVQRSGLVESSKLSLARAKEKAALLFMLRLNASVSERRTSVDAQQRELQRSLSQRRPNIVDRILDESQATATAGSQLTKPELAHLLSLAMCGGDPIRELQQQAAREKRNLISKSATLKATIQDQKEQLRHLYESKQSRQQQLTRRAKLVGFFTHARENAPHPHLY